MRLKLHLVLLLLAVLIISASSFQASAVIIAKQSSSTVSSFTSGVSSATFVNSTFYNSTSYSYTTAYTSSVVYTSSARSTSSVSVLNDYPVIFAERGLAENASWSVSLQGVIQKASALSPIVFYEPEGAYSYTVSGPSGSSAQPSSGQLTVSPHGTISEIGSLNLAQYGPQGMAFDSANGYVYVTNPQQHSVAILNGIKVVANVTLPSDLFVFNYSVPAYPTTVAYDPSNGYVYVAGYNGTGVYVLNGTKLLGAIQTYPSNATDSQKIVDGSVMGLAYDPQNGYVYAAQTFAQAISIISGTKILGKIAMNSNPQELAYDSWNGQLYVSSENSGAVYEIQGTSVAANITVDNAQYSTLGGIAFDPSNGCIYVGDYNAQTVAVINGSSVIGTVPMPSTPAELAFNPENHLVYATASWQNGSINLINGVKLIASIQDSSPGTWGLAYDTLNSTMYVSNLQSGVISIYSSGVVRPINFSIVESSTASGSSTQSASNTSTTTSTLSITSTSQQPNSTYLVAAVVVAAVTIGATFGALVIQRSRKSG